ncbi:antibiotic biosynthesis monooxygenase [bacterium]|nr:antibiotic biosynthesis monooxygenase [bacterium]
MSSIARVWYGRTPSSKGEDYVEYMKRTGVKDLNNTEGNRGVLLLKRLNGDVTEFTIISFWDSKEAIKRFAGEDINKARYYPEDAKYLLEMPPELEHYDVSVASGLKL